MKSVGSSDCIRIMIWILSLFLSSGFFALQHRGQEACGISVLKEGRITNMKDEGLVLDVYKDIQEPETFMGNSAIGHTRYTTAGDKKEI
ncbi:hypothetical protein MUB42_03130 [Apilactobacillus kunkeei]|nr:hypothetical protein MUB42_03130 [Apilactobacillus kunkeei]